GDRRQSRALGGPHYSGAPALRLWRSPLARRGLQAHPRRAAPRGERASSLGAATAPRAGTRCVAALSFSKLMSLANSYGQFGAEFAPGSRMIASSLEKPRAKRQRKEPFDIDAVMDRVRRSI